MPKKRCMQHISTKTNSFYSWFSLMLQISLVFVKNLFSHCLIHECRGKNEAFSDQTDQILSKGLHILRGKEYFGSKLVIQFSWIFSLNFLLQLLSLEDI